MISSMSPMASDIPYLQLEIPTASAERFWQPPSAFSANGIRWLASLNQMCLDTLLPWIRDTHAPNAQAWINPAAMPSIWEVVNGSAIALGQQRLIIIPTAASDFEELRVPQEWVDLPSWAGHYYVPVYVNPDDGEIWVLGYVTHHTLKQQGTYDPRDRTYSIASEDLLCDFNVLWTARRLCPNEGLQAAIAPLPSLPLERAKALIERLGDSTLVVPRLAVPFEVWGALVEHGGWRQQLYQHRLKLPEPGSVRQWLQTEMSGFAQQLGWGTMNLQAALARGSSYGSANGLVRHLTIAGNLYEFRVFQQSEAVWRFELQSAAIGGLVPGGFKLRLLTEDLMPFENNEDSATSAIAQLYLEVCLSPGDALIWEIEPLPDFYDREILRF
ncbi:DUF1822 family protein [Myxacorys almedinensis]|uniref:DUF1822 family protein n=1 Tax=Myxacorys almedinensis A TaxID=2690445 RepID=A0A8J7Z4G9_9CYAN|nr:DUF1822 family protein [Myxacorys almedinensis]NDJ18001.1 DUF1822 family protein [Myxacorys almedinensis A]